MSSDNWQSVYVTTQEYLAHIVKDLLNGEGIEAVVVDKQDSFYVTIGEIEVYVQSDQVIRAKHIIKKANF